MRMGKTKSLSVKQSILWNSAGSLIFLICNWLTTVIVVIVSPSYSNAGSLAVAMAVGNIFGAIVLFKVRPFQVSDIENRYSSGDYVGFRFLCLLAGILFCLVYCYFTVAPSDYIVVLVYLVFKGADTFVDVYYGIDQQHNRLDFAAISQIVRGVLLVGLFSLGLYVTGSLVIAVLLMALSTVFIIIVYDVPRSASLASLKPLLDKKRIKRIIVECSPGFVASLACTAVVSIARQGYGLQYGNELLGIYAAIATPAVVIQAVASYIYAPLLGPIAKAQRKKEAHKIWNIVIRFFVILGIATIVILLLFFFVATPLFSFVYGENIVQYLYLLTPVLVSTTATAVMMFMLDLLIVFRDNVAVVLCNVVPLVICIVFMNFFFSIANMNGISFVIIFAYSIGVVISMARIAVNLKRLKADKSAA